MAHKKGTPKTPGSGRKKGTPNKSTQLLKDAVIKAAQAAGVKKSLDKSHTGLERYLIWLAVEQPVAFTSLLNKVLPLQIGGTSDEGEGININISFTDTKDT